MAAIVQQRSVYARHKWTKTWACDLLNIALGFTLAYLMEKSGYARLGEPGGSRASLPGAAKRRPLRRREAASVKSGPAGRDFNASVRNKRAKTKQAKALLGYAKAGSLPGSLVRSTPQVPGKVGEPGFSFS